MVQPLHRLASLPVSLDRYRTKPLSPARAGSFNANFPPETLDAFKALCRSQGRQYTKVLQSLAEVYLDTNGEVLNGSVSIDPPPPDAKKRQVQVESLQNKLLEDLLKRVELLEKQKVKTEYEIDRIHKNVAFMQSGLKEPTL